MNVKRLFLFAVVLSVSLGAVAITLRAAQAVSAQGRESRLADAPPGQALQSAILDSSTQVTTSHFVYTNTVSLVIPDNYCSSYITSQLYVAEAMFVYDVNVGLNIQHPYRSDLKVRLRAPDGKWTDLLVRNGGSLQNFDILLDQEAAAPPGGPPGNLSHDVGKPYYDYHWKPIGDLGLFRHTYSQGVWVLEICDSLPSFTGQLNFWSLWLELGQPAPDLEASYVVAPAKVVAGKPISYTIVLKNKGSASAYDASMDDPIPEGSSFVLGSLECSVNFNCYYTPVGPQGPSVHWNGSLYPGEDVTVTFAVDTFTPRILTNEVIINDPDIPAEIRRVILTYAVEQLYHLWDFEADDGGFVSVGNGNNEWEWGLPTIGPPLYRPTAWGTDLDDLYDPDTVSILQKVVDLSEIPTGTRLSLQWWEWYAIQPGDLASFSINGVELFNFDGFSEHWVHRELDISTYAGQSLTLGWMLTSDKMNNDMGWYIDNVSIHTPMPGADLGIIKQDYPDPVVISETLVYTLTVTNYGPVDAMDVKVVDDLPRGVIPGSISPLEICYFTTDGRSAVCQLGVMGVGQIAEIVIQVTPDPEYPNLGRQLINNASVSHVGTDPNPANDAASEDTTLRETPLTAPIVASVTPQSGVNTQATLILIQGDNFQHGMTVTLDSTPLQEVNFVSSQRVWATVPAGMTPGTYDLTVIAPDGGRGVLLDAFTVLADAPPTLTSISPERGLNATPVSVDIYGTNFSQEMSAVLRSSAPASAVSRRDRGVNHLRAGYPTVEIVLEGVRFVRSTRLRATVPMNIPPGVYDLIVTDSVGNSAELPGAYTALDPTLSDDLYAFGASDLWLDPPSVQAGQTPTIGLTIHRQGGQTDLENVAVDFYNGDPAAGGVKLGQGIAPLLPPRGKAAASILWTPPPARGRYTLYALIDPANGIPEDDEANNTISHTLRILPADPSVIPLVISEFTINSGADQTSQRQVYLNVTAAAGIEAASRPQVNQPTYLLFIEYMFTQSDGDWIMVAQSDWLPYDTAHLDYPWDLQPTGGVHYLQVWVADDAGNVSPEPGLAFINYMPLEDHVAEQEAHIYRFELAAGEMLLARLTSLIGDADLYVWDPNGNEVDRRETGEMVEEIQFTAAMSGTFQIEVEGFTSADYRLEVIPMAVFRQGGNGYPAANIAGREGRIALEPQQRGRGHPISDSQPGDDVGLPEIPVYTVYLPAVKR